jgi:ABC-type Fe3+/spermidine/putrescine transport system ATPase subunit
MSDLRALAESIKAARDERRTLTQARIKEIAEERGETQKMLSRFSDEHARASKQDAQNRAAELNAIRSRANAIQAEAKGLLKTFAQARNEMAQTILSDAKELRRKLSADNKTRLNAHKTFMMRIGGEHQALKETVHSIASNVQRSLKEYEQSRREGREAWHRLLGGGELTAAVQAPSSESPFAINIPFAPQKKKRRK